MTAHDGTDATPAIDGQQALLVGIELIVADLERAIEMWTDVVGWTLAEVGETSAIAGRYAVVTDQRMAVTLMQPAASGPGVLLSDRQPRLSQIILSVPPADLDRHRDLAAERGLSVVPGGHGYFLSPEAVAGALGLEVAVVVTPDVSAREP